jgi:hypothetical protein
VAEIDLEEPEDVPGLAAASLAAIRPQISGPIAETPIACLRRRTTTASQSDLSRRNRNRPSADSAAVLFAVAAPTAATHQLFRSTAQSLLALSIVDVDD